MKTKTVFSCLAAVLALAVSPSPGLSQHVGLQIGVAQPQAQFGFPPTQAPAIAVRSTFTAVPIIVVPPAQGIAPIPLVPNFPTVIVPNQVLVPGQTVFGPSSNQPNLPSGPPVRPGRPLPGTSRTDVLRQFGQPSVTVITSTGETLYFTGGVIVILQNGQVIGAR